MKNAKKSPGSPAPKVLMLSALARGSVVGDEVIRLVIDQIRSSGAEPNLLSLKAQNLPLFDGERDLQEFPLEAKHLEQSIRHHHALMIIAPDYHQGIASLVKNSLDWAGQTHAMLFGESLLLGKPVGIVSVSVENHLGVQALTQMAALCHTLGGRVLPGSMGVLDQIKVLGEDNRMKDQGLVKRLSDLASDLVRWIKSDGESFEGTKNERSTLM
jgi:NAD(P)H-dependent FMN reductase